MLTRLFAALSFALLFNHFLFAQAGAPDLTFGHEGRVTTNIFPSDDQGFSVLLRPDGRIVTAGRATMDSINQFGVAQFRPDGTLDETFDSDGKVNANILVFTKPAIAYAGALYPDGRTIFAGIAGLELAEDFALLRLTPAGLPDTSFGASGHVTTDFNGGSDFAFAAMIQADEKIVAAGYTTTDNIEADFALARYLLDGQLDTTFGDNGRVVHSFSPNSDVIHDALLQPDGKIVAAGQIYDDLFASDFIVARFLADGQLDSTFGNNGVATINIGVDDLGRGLSLQPDDKIIVAGVSTIDLYPKISVLRLETDGTLDETFGNNGFLLLEAVALGNFCTDVLVQPDGGILLSGMVETGDFRDFFVMRRLSDGSPDMGFGTDGVVITSVSAKDDNSYRLALQPDGSILLVGVSDRGSHGDLALLRYTEDGKLDQSFGNGGAVLTDLGSSQDIANDLIIQTDGKLLVGGYAQNDIATATPNSDFALARYSFNGILDTTFGAGGIRTSDFSPSFDRVRAMLLQADEKMIGVGEINRRAGLARYWPDGSLDETFGNAGASVSGFPQTSVYNAGLLQADGKIVVAGYDGSINGDNVIVRYLPDGSLDPDFGLNGLATTPFPPGTGKWDRLLVDPAGNITAFGTWSDLTPGALLQVVMARYGTDGTLDATFANNGLYVSSLSPEPLFLIRSALLLSDGKILIAGTKDEDFAIARLHQNGSVDSTFGTDGLVFFDYDQHLDLVNGLAVQSNGYIVAAGQSTSLIPGADNQLVALRLKADGTPDPAFGQGGLIHFPGGSAARAVQIQADGNIVLASTTGLGIGRLDFQLLRLLAGPTVGLIDRTESGLMVDIYPNPVAESLQVEYELAENQPISIHLFDDAGRLVATFFTEKNRAAGTHRETLQLPADLPAGYYTVKFTTGKGGSRALKIIKV